jgi:hypothetical protein
MGIVIAPPLERLFVACRKPPACWVGQKRENSKPKTHSPLYMRESQFYLIHFITFLREKYACQRQ